MCAALQLSVGLRPLPQLRGVRPIASSRFPAPFAGCLCGRELGMYPKWRGLDTTHACSGSQLVSAVGPAPSGLASFPRITPGRWQLTQLTVNEMLCAGSGRQHSRAQTSAGNCRQPWVTSQHRLVLQGASAVAEMCGGLGGDPRGFLGAAAGFWHRWAPASPRHAVNKQSGFPGGFSGALQPCRWQAPRTAAEWLNPLITRLFWSLNTHAATE